MGGDWVLCGACHGLRGSVEGRGRQRCDCEPSGGEERWPGYDFNLALELCRICAVRVLRSGSRWSVWLCDACKPLARSLNDCVGVCVVPLGRHSLMNGVGVAAGDAGDRRVVDAFVQNLGSLLERMDLLATWRRSVVADNRRLLGVPDGEDVALARYLEVASDERTAPERRFEELVASLQPG